MWSHSQQRRWTLYTLFLIFSGCSHDGEDKPPEKKLKQESGDRKKRKDRFNGMPEEEVVQRILPDHLHHNLDIVIVSLRHSYCEYDIVWHSHCEFGWLMMISLEWDINLFMIELGRSLMIGWRKKTWNPERLPSVVTLSVCVCVCARATGHTFWPRNLIFGLSDPWDMRKMFVCFFEIFIFTRFIGIFRCFP